MVVNSVAGLPAASTAAGTLFHMADPAVPGDLYAVTNISGTTLTVTRGADGTTPAAHSAGFTLRQVVSAQWLQGVYSCVSPLWYGAVPDGSTDCTTALQSAINAAQAANLPVLLPAGTMVCGQVTVSPGNTLVMRGYSKEGSVLQLKNGANAYLIALSPGTNFITVDFRDFTIDGNSVNQTAACGCIYGAGSVQSRYDNLHFKGFYDIGLYLYQNTNGGFGHHNRVTRCLFDGSDNVSGANQKCIQMQSCDENFIAWNDFEHWGGLASNPGTEPYAIKDWSGLQEIIGNVFVGGQEAIRVQDSQSTRIIGNTFDGVGRNGVHLSGSKNVVVGNLFSNGGTSNPGNYSQCEVDFSTSATIAGNAFFVNSNGVVKAAVRELTANANRTLVVDNVIDLSSGSLATGNQPVQFQGNQSVAKNNLGWNPLCSLAAPAAPALSTNASGGTLTAGTYQAKATLVNSFGETTASVAASIVVAANGTLTINPPVAAGNAYGWYAYVTTAGGATFTRQQTAGAPSALNSSLTLTANPTTGGANPPGSNTTAAITAPGVPATTVGLQNTTGTDVQVYLTAGSGSTCAITLGSTAIATVPASAVFSFRLPAGQFVFLTYTSAPTWVWDGE